MRQIRNGVELPPPIEDQNYDFNYQTPIIRFSNPAQMLPVGLRIEGETYLQGDDLILECVYDTTDGRTNVTLVIPDL